MCRLPRDEGHITGVRTPARDAALESPCHRRCGSALLRRRPDPPRRRSRRRCGRSRKARRDRGAARSSEPGNREVKVGSCRRSIRRQSRTPPARARVRGRTPPGTRSDPMRACLAAGRITVRPVQSVSLIDDVSTPQRGGAALFWGAVAGSSLVLGALIAIFTPVSMRPGLVCMAFGAACSSPRSRTSLSAMGPRYGGWALGPARVSAAATFFVGDTLIDRYGGKQTKALIRRAGVGSPLAILLGTAGRDPRVDRVGPDDSRAVVSAAMLPRCSPTFRRRLRRPAA
jgi:hypothetical protein